MLRQLLLIGLSLSLAACSTFKPQPPVPASSWEQHKAALQQLSSWDISGKIGIITATSSNSASLKWLQEKHHYQIDIRGPLGQGGASITGTPNHVTVDVAGEGTFSGPDPEFILYQQLGWQLPISDIYWWVRGLPAPDKSFEHSLENNRLKTLQQNGWTIRYLSYNGLTPALPKKLKLSHDSLKITLVINSWITL